MDSQTEIGKNPKQSLRHRVSLIGAFLIPGLFLLWLLLMTGFIIFVPVVALVFWCFRQHRSNNLKAKWKLGIALLIASLLFSGAMIWGMLRSTRRPDRYLIPQGYVGWVIVEYNAKGAPPLPLEEGHDLCKIPRDGRLETSSSLEDGWASDEFFYISAKGRQVIKRTGWGEGGMIWGGSTSDGSVGIGTDKGMKTVHTSPTETFFVGTEQQFQKAGPKPHSHQMEKIMDAI